MSPNGFFEHVCVLLLLSILVRIDSQRLRARTSGNQNKDDAALQNSPDCNCIPIRRCNTLRYREDWRTVGETCEFGYGEYRKVCCPLKSPPCAAEKQASNTSANAGVCGESKSEGMPLVAGTNGGNATEGQFPWMVDIRQRNSTGVYFSRCSGFLIDKRRVLSAARCYYGKEKNLFRARIGSINHEEADEYRISQISLHPNFSTPAFHNNIAVLTLDRDVNFPNFNPICLPDERVRNIDLVGRRLTAAGFQTYLSFEAEQNVYLRYGTLLEVRTNKRCEDSFKETSGDYNMHFPHGFNEAHICTKAVGDIKDVCAAFPGSPLMIRSRSRWYAVGVGSWTYMCPYSRVEYAKISEYLDFIKQN